MYDVLSVSSWRSRLIWSQTPSVIQIWFDKIHCHSLRVSSNSLVNVLYPRVCSLVYWNVYKIMVLNTKFLPPQLSLECICNEYLVARYIKIHSITSTDLKHVSWTFFNDFLQIRSQFDDCVATTKADQNSVELINGHIVWTQQVGCVPTSSFSPPLSVRQTRCTPSVWYDWVNTNWFGATSMTCFSPCLIHGRRISPCLCPVSWVLTNFSVSVA